MVVKLQYKASKRLAEVDLTVESVRKTLGAYFGEAAAKGPLFFSLSAADDELLSLETDEDVKLAAVAAVEPVKVVSMGGQVEAKPPRRAVPPSAPVGRAG